MHRSLCALAAVACAWFPPVTVLADELPSPLPLGQLLAAVRARNPLVSQRRHAARAASLKPRAEGLPDDPMVELEWWQQPVNFSSVPLMLTVRQPIPYPGTLRLRREVAEREARAMSDDVAQATRQLEAAAKRAYFDLVLAERSLEVNQRVRDIDAHLVEVTEALYRVGKAVQPDLLRAQSELLSVENERLDLEQQRDDATARMNALLDRAAGAPLGPTATPASLVPLPSEKELVERALAGRPEVARARDELAAATSRAALERRGKLPELAASASYMVNIGGVDTFTLGVSSTLPIFSSRRAAARADVADAEVAAARENLEALRRATEAEVHATLLELSTAERHVHLHAEKLIPLADVTLDSATASYQTGRVDFNAVLDAARMLRDHHLSHLKFLVEYRRKLADLEALVGDLDGGGR